MARVNLLTTMRLVRRRKRKLSCSDANADDGVAGGGASSGRWTGAAAACADAVVCCSGGAGGSCSGGAAGRERCGRCDFCEAPPTRRAATSSASSPRSPCRRPHPRHRLSRRRMAPPPSAVARWSTTGA